MGSDALYAFMQESDELPEMALLAPLQADRRVIGCPYVLQLIREHEL